MDLVEELKRRQGDKTQMEFAAEIGINQGNLSRIYSGDRRIGARVARKLKKRFPDLTLELAAFLLASDMTPEHDQMAS